MTDPIVKQIENERDCEYLLDCLFDVKDIDNDCYTYIAENETVTNEEISRKLDRDSSTVHRSLKRLEDAGLIDKQKVTYSEGGYEYQYYQRNPKKVRGEIESTIEDWKEMVDELLDEFERNFDN